MRTIIDYNVSILKNGKWNILKSDIEKAIYLIVFQPKDDIYEVRRPKGIPQKKHVIKKNDIVLKFGKVESGLFGRLEGSYSKHWKYSHVKYGKKHTYSNCFNDNTSIYLLSDLSNSPNKFVRLMEKIVKELIESEFALSRQEKGTRSEYRCFDEKYTSTDVEKRIAKIINILEKIRKILNDKG